jgi:ABC-type nitrate/sulfonate/bicarbonate transport system substrate-binding protein
VFSIRRTLSCLAVGAFAVTALLRGPVAAADAPVVIHESFPSKVATFWPSFIAQAQGFYTNQGLQVEDLVVDPNVTVATLIGGSVEVSFADSTQLLLALEKGANLVAVGIETDKNPYKLMAPAGIKTLKDLKGKRIGVASAIDVYTYVAHEMLRKAGLDPDKDVEWIVGGGQNQRLSAIVAGAIQAGFFTPPSDSKLAAQGFNTLAFAPDYFPDLTLSATSVKRDWAIAHPDVLRHFLAAQSDAVKWLYVPGNHARAVQILEQATNSSPAEAEDSYTYYVGKHVFPANACVTRLGLENVVKIMRQTGQLKTVTVADVPKFTDTQWCPK